MLRHVYFETVYLIVSRDDINSREEGRKFRFIKGNIETKKNTMIVSIVIELKCSRYEYCN